MTPTIDDVRNYWNTHLNLTQFLGDKDLEPGSDRFFEEIERVFDRYGYKDRVFRDFAKDAAGKTLLEIGCGLGIELGKLGQLGFDVTGIDLAPQAAELANLNLKRKGVTGRAVVANAEALDFPDATFDVVYSSGVLQHTPDMDRAIAEIRRVLKPGGRILIVLYHRHSWFYVLHRLSRQNIEFDDQDAPIINVYTKGELRRLFSAFEDISVTCEYYRPERTGRTGFKAALYNNLFVPVMGALPTALVRDFGWHLVLTATKSGTARQAKL